MNAKKVVIIGNGMVGHRFCEKLSKKQPNFELVVFGEEPIPAYDRVHLTDYLGKKTLDDLFLAKNQWYEENNIELHLHDPILQINTAEKCVISQNGIQTPYDYLRSEERRVGKEGESRA